MHVPESFYAVCFGTVLLMSVSGVQVGLYEGRVSNVAPDQAIVQGCVVNCCRRFFGLLDNNDNKLRPFAFRKLGREIAERRKFERHEMEYWIVVVGYR